MTFTTPKGPRQKQVQVRSTQKYKNIQRFFQRSKFCVAACQNNVTPAWWYPSLYTQKAKKRFCIDLKACFSVFFTLVNQKRLDRANRTRFFPLRWTTSSAATESVYVVWRSHVRLSTSVADHLFCHKNSTAKTSQWNLRYQGNPEMSKPHSQNALALLEHICHIWSW